MSDRPLTDAELADFAAEVAEHWGVLEAYRSAHNEPMARVLRLVAERCDASPQPALTLRSKTMDRIFNKLRRYPTGRSEQDELVRRLRAYGDDTNNPVRMLDHVSDPAPDGYRAVHLIFREDGVQIEVQVRTTRQERWAQAVEGAEVATGFNVKDHEAPREFMEYFERAAYMLALEDEGSGPDADFERAFAILRQRVAPHYAAKKSS